MLICDSSVNLHIIIAAGAGTHEAFTQVGLCVLAGIFVFIIVEMMASNESPEPQNNNSKEKIGENKKDVSVLLFCFFALSFFLSFFFLLIVLFTFLAISSMLNF